MPNILNNSTKQPFIQSVQFRRLINKSLYVKLTETWKKSIKKGTEKAAKLSDKNKTWKNQNANASSVVNKVGNLAVVAPPLSYNFLTVSCKFLMIRGQYEY